MGGHTYFPAAMRAITLRHLAMATTAGIAGGLVWRAYQNRVTK